jgi:3-hydroxyisobutyrate dehydrogenase-like beta-hydroxyacid dehydrogenase
MVPDDRTLLQITLGEGGILNQLGTGGIHVSCSTVSPNVSEQLAKLYQKHRCTYLAATVLGRPDVAERGALSILLAGKLAAKQRVKPLLASMGTRLYDLGEQVEVANVAKIACNFLIASAIEAMGEAAALADAYGLDRPRFFQVLKESPLFSGTVFEGYGAMIGARDFSDNRFPVKYGLKDVELAIQVGQHHELDLPYADVAFEHLLAAQEAGRGNEDWAVLSDFARPGVSDGLFNKERF